MIEGDVAFGTAPCWELAGHLTRHLGLQGRIRAVIQRYSLLLNKYRNSLKHRLKPTHSLGLKTEAGAHSEKDCCKSLKNNDLS